MTIETGHRGRETQGLSTKTKRGVNKIIKETQLETNKLMMRTGTGRTKYGHKRETNTGQWEKRSDITPPS